MRNITLIVFLLIGLSGYAQDLNMQNGTFNQCTGIFYDSGGQNGNYSSNENLVTTICADNPGDFIILNFTEFSTQLNSDTLTIYDGDDTTAPIIGTFSGVAAPGVIQASDTNTSGCLTIEFQSNATGTTTGWAAEITCATPCQDIVASIDSTNPAAVGGIIEVDPGDIIEFNGSATFSVGGNLATYEWDFGDTQTDAGTTVNHAYANPGTYTVTFTVTDDNPLGCSDSVTITVEVKDNDTCAGALPICSGIENVPSPTGDATAESGIDYDCLGSQPDPRWYFLQTSDTPGNLFFTLTQYTGQNQTGTGIDVDFIIWGPFSEPVCGPENLNSSTQVDCSFSAAAIEQITILNAPANSYYMLLITNFAQSAGFINLELNPNSTSDTSCDIICQVDLGLDQEICNGADYTINPDFNGAFNTFEWQKDGVTIPGETGSTLTVTESGTYTLIAEGFDAVFGDPCTTQDEVVITIGGAFTLNDNVSISECSVTNTATFDLNDAVADLLAPADPADYTVTYYNSQNDAENDLNSVNPAAYLGTDGEVIYVRVVETATNCFEVGSFQLTINTLSIPAVLTPLEECDDAVADGFTAFTLTEADAEVLGTQDPADYTVTYH
ncbi:PKD domain-containing protein, partial [Winogradskyella sp. 3972H.M.0a.05]|uniref:PKD domain-containing protein n=1 Tax=Winogradskyella sp. 3972H.M.0a.05 TaxID=2950277 RepID=UPI0033986A47